jgi:hypothetical protein
MTPKGKKNRSNSKSSQLAEGMTMMSFAAPKEWREMIKVICGYGKRFDSLSALMRKLVDEYLAANPPTEEEIAKSPLRRHSGKN